MVITNLEHLSSIAPENDRKYLERKTSRNVKGGSRIREGSTAIASAKVRGIALGNQVAFVVGSTVTLAITL